MFSASCSYRDYEALRDVLEPFQNQARLVHSFLDARFSPFAHAYCEMVMRFKLTHERPAFGIAETTIDGKSVAVREEVVRQHPFMDLLRFVKDAPVQGPPVLLAAPLSGHFATLLRGTIETLLPGHDVYVTDWKNARDVPRQLGAFSLGECVVLLADVIRWLGPDTHVVAVCQPAVPVLAAVALLSEEDTHVAPASMTLMAGPIDTRIAPTKVNHLATSHPLEWFEERMVDRVPWRYRGRGRLVYPGFRQIGGFMALDPDRHIKAHVDLFRDLVCGNVEDAEATRIFYDEYFSVMDLPAEFYIETIDQVFQRHTLPRGMFTAQGHLVDPSAIMRTALLVVEGARDDICAPGQTRAAFELVPDLSTRKRRYHLQSGVGHYGTFNGKRWQNEVYPVLHDFIQQNSR